MHKKFLFALALTSFAAVSRADVLSYPVTTVPFDNATGLTITIPYTTSTPYRAFYLSGTWSRVTSGNAFSADLKSRLQIGTINYITTSYQIGGASNTSPFIFGNYGSTWNNLNTSLTPGTPFQMQDAPLSGTLSYRLTAGTGVTGTVQVASGTLNVLTDAVAPWQGSLAGAPTFRRPNNLTTLAGSTTSTYRYRTTTFTPTVTATYAIIGDWRTGVGSSYDGHLNLYANGFNPASPLTNLVGVDDDGDLEGTLVSRAHTSGMLIRLTAGTTYTLVATEFNSGASSTLGTFNVFIAGPNQVISQPLTGQIELGDLATSESGYKVDIEIREPVTGTLLATYPNVTLAAGGEFSIQVANSIAASPFDVAVKAKNRWMRGVQPLISLPAGTVSLTLVNGDVDGDNEVSIIDYIALSTNYETSLALLGEAAWTSRSESNFNTAPVDSDLDGDGEVSILDYIILSTNYGLTGQP